MLFVNFKTYKEATGVRAVELVRICSILQAETKVPIIPCVQATDIRSCMIATNYNIWAQHIDPSTGSGQATGWVTPEAVAEAGAVGTLLNHSEHKIENIEIANSECQEIGLDTMIFAADLGELESVIKLKPTYMAYEPPELIAAKETSVAKAKPDIIKKAVAVAKKAGVPLIVGAGVKDADDVKTALKLGAIGVAVSSAVVLAEDQKRAILELARGFK